MVVGCSGSPEAAPSVSAPPGAVVVKTVKSDSLDGALSFAPQNLSATAGQGFELAYVNTDGFPHDVVIVAPDGHSAFSTEIRSNRGQALYQVPALAAGSYQLKCDIHSDMRAVLTVQ
jgi:plastocyanin